jgi:hypothetical protein
VTDFSAGLALLAQAEQSLAARDPEAAAALFRRAEMHGADPDRCAAGRWMAYMLAGDFAAAWKQSDAIRASARPDPHRFWNGEDLAGKRVIVRCLHGFGDAVQLLRYAPCLRSLCKEVIFEVPPALLALAQSFDGVEHVVTWGERAPSTEQAWDVQVEVMELPYIFRTRLGELPLAEHYLTLPETLLSTVAAEMAPRGLPRIGLVWSAGEWNASRSLPPALLAPLLEEPACEFWNLQGGPAREALDGLREIDACSNGILPLAAVIAQMDLVITVDTLSAHLAGALGVPAWVMLQDAADWRWMTDRDDSPWYRSLRLFRQPAAGDWASVVARLRAELPSNRLR